MSRLFLPPINRSMRTLDRTLFQKTILISAARIFDQKNISRVKKDCGKDILEVRRLRPMYPDPDQERYPGKKVLLMQPEVRHDDMSTANPKTQELVRNKIMEIIPFELQMQYDNWSYEQIMHAILPEELHDDMPVSFSAAGHLAHLNLRQNHLPYKHIIGECILDKNASLRAVVNKLEDVGAHNPFRTFKMEFLAGEHDTLVTVKESDCIFQFDFAKVYWNTRLGYEHERIVSMFSSGEIICDVMAGVGPFALPAAKKNCLVWANDLNPESYHYLNENIKRNKLTPFVTPFNQDGREFIRHSIRDLYRRHKDPKYNRVTIPGREPPRHLKKLGVKRQDYELPLPGTFAHFVMNLPASAVEFVDAFIGSYRGLEELKDQMPMIHVYTFHREVDDAMEKAAPKDICAELSKSLRYEINPEHVEVYQVRKVAPSKVYYCASFRLPVEVAFSEEEMKPVVDGNNDSREDDI